MAISPAATQNVVPKASASAAAVGTPACCDRAAIAVEPALTAAPDAADSAAAAARAVEIVARAQPAVLCAHGENLGPALRAVCEYLGSQVPGEARLDKGGFWALHTSGQRLAGAEQYRLPADQGVRTR